MGVILFANEMVPPVIVVGVESPPSVKTVDELPKLGPEKSRDPVTMVVPLDVPPVFDPEMNSVPLFITVLSCESGWDMESGIARMLSGTTMDPKVRRGEILTVFPMVVPLMLRVAPVTGVSLAGSL
jgi:hypothetical protein